MPYYISGVTADYNLLIARTPHEFKSMNDIEIRTRHEVLSIDPGLHSIHVRDMTSETEFDDEYTRLLISTGARAFVPPVEGTGLAGVFTIRRLEDGIRIKDHIKAASPRRAVIVGSGPIGLEMCESLRTVGLEVTLIDLAPRVMPMMSEEMSGIVQARLESEGVTCLLGQGLEGIEGDREGSVRAVVTQAGPIDADFVLLGIGIKPDAALASAAGIEIGTRGAVRVDEHMLTGAEDVWCAGDCATTTNTITGQETWVPLGSTSRKQGRVAGENMAGGHGAFPGVQGTAIVKCFDLTVGRTGLDDTEARQAGFDPVTVEIEAESLHKYYPGSGTIHLQVTADRRTARMLGAEVTGSIDSQADKRLDVLAVAIRAGMTVDELQYLDLAYAPAYSTAIDSPLIIGNVMSGKIHGAGCSCDGHGLDL